MKIRIMSLTPIQQKIVKLKSDGKSNDEIASLLGLPLDEVEAAEVWIERKLSKRWKKSVSECWRIIKNWNAASSLIVFICLAPMLENIDTLRARAPTRLKTQYSRVTRLSRKR
ncbi:hypothetical protein [Vibrio phage vB_VpM-pA2SJ1]|uniref:HTH luxR-type domain-containing protein n=1 Tax=Vibrio phage vB_VpM-pA2SJ1 TaxID=3095964 RepID=A0AAX4J5C0_9CAUD